MNKNNLWVLIGMSMLACNFLVPQTPSINEVPGSVSATQTVPTDSGVEDLITPTFQLASESSAELLISYDEMKVVRLHPSAGDLQTLISLEAKHATALGLMPIVEFDATWCPPCLAIDKAIKEKNELMLSAYRGTYIIKFDVDEWGWNDGVLENFNFEFIPVYFKVNANGEQTGETINGGAWGEDIPENIAPVMDIFFHDN